jgi:hypothetical protein
VNATDHTGLTAFKIAIINADVVLVELLLLHGANPMLWILSMIPLLYILQQAWAEQLVSK